MTPNKSIKTLCVLLGLCLTLGSCGPNQQSSSSATPSTLERVASRKTVMAGWAPYAPYATANLQVPGGQPQGYYIELFERLASEAGFDVVWVETTWTTMISDLKVGKFDVMAAPVFRTIPRATAVAFTNAIDYFGLSAVVRADDARFSSVYDFNRPEIRISVVQGEVGEEFAARHLPDAELTRHKSGSIAVALVDVIQGRSDVGICDAWTARQFVAEHPGEVRDLFGEDPFNKVGAGWFVRSDDLEFLQFLNTAVDWLKTSGALEEIATRYELPSFQ